jgi:DeoR family transcriptional regulator, aga operon transcriptional repressor
MTRDERLSGLLEILAREGRIDVEVTSRELGVSAATIRRDLDHLAQQQMLTRTHGGAVANSVSYDLPLRYKTARHASEKQRIGAAAAGLVAPGAIVGLNGGTTTTEVARAIATRAGMQPSGRGPAVTVVTNALNIANELTVRPHTKIVVTGGVARPQSYELTGPLTSWILNQTSLDIAFLGVDALDAELGASAHDEDEASVNQLMASRAKQVVVVADSTKIGQRAFARICDLSAIDILITDTGTSEKDAAQLTNAGLRVLRV